MKAEHTPTKPFELRLLADDAFHVRFRRLLLAEAERRSVRRVTTTQLLRELAEQRMTEMGIETPSMPVDGRQLTLPGTGAEDLSRLDA